ncbi:MAG: hypothetical protein AAAB17_10005 [Pseudomonas sp.]
MTWDSILSTFALAFSGASLVFMLYWDIRVWQGQKRVRKAQKNYADALEKATDQLKANPTAWLDHMMRMDDKRRMN